MHRATLSPKERLGWGYKSRCQHLQIQTLKTAPRQTAVSRTVWSYLGDLKAHLYKAHPILGSWFLGSLARIGGERQKEGEKQQLGGL